jgi:hypothetical protein
MVMDENERALGGGGASVPEPKLQSLVKGLERAFRGQRRLGEAMSDLADYRVFVCEQDDKTKSAKSAVTLGSRLAKARVFNFWAFSPGLALEDLQRLGVRTIIMTSGDDVKKYYFCLYN